MVIKTKYVFLILYYRFFKLSMRNIINFLIQYSVVICFLY